MEGLESQNGGDLDAEEMPDQTAKMPATLSSPHSAVERTAETPQKVPARAAEPGKPVSASRKRVLPPWMLQGGLSSSPLVLGSGNEERRKRPGKKRKTTTSEDATVLLQDIQGVATESTASKVGNNSSRVVSQIPKSSTVQNACPVSSQPVHQSIDGDTSNKTGIEEDNSASKAERQGIPSRPPGPQDENEAFIPDQTTEAEISELTGSSNVPQSSNITKPKRIPCQYARNCYRKNPVHFQQFSHPGDSDYHDPEVVTAADSDQRPECPYGTACYRKNPQHKKEYKHTAPPEPERRSTRPKPTKKGRSVLEDESDNDGGPNEYDLNDSFIDDEEEEECEPTDEDSDWEPDVEDKASEDVDTLMKEAQEFVKTKK